MYRGIDVSEWQGNIDWSLVKTEIDFAIIRCVFLSSKIDKFAEENCINANKHNVPIGLYCFSNATSVESAKREAINTVNFAKKYNIQLPIFWDCEYQSEENAKKLGVKYTADLVRRMCEAFCETVKQYGYKVGVYFNYDWLKKYYTLDFFTPHPDYVKWYARPTGIIPIDTTYDIEQYSWYGNIKGIKGNVDLNYSNNILNKKNRKLIIEMRY